VKRFVSILIVLLISLQSAFAQDTGDAFLRHWTNHETNTGMVVYKDAYDRFQAIQWDLEDGEIIKVSDLTIIGDVMSFTSFTESTNWTVHAKFTKQGDDDMEEVVDGPASEAIVISWIRETP
jgi:hypothetical protein